MSRAGNPLYKQLVGLAWQHLPEASGLKPSTSNSARDKLSRVHKVTFLLVTRHAGNQLDVQRHGKTQVRTHHSEGFNSHSTQWCSLSVHKGSDPQGGTAK